MEKAKLNFETVPVTKAREVAASDVLSASDFGVEEYGASRPEPELGFIAPNQTTTPKNGGWRQLCEAVISERDPDRMLALVNELNQSLDEALGSARRPTRPATA